MHARAPLLVAAAFALLAAGCAPGPRPGRPQSGEMRAMGRAMGAGLFVSPSGQVFRPGADGVGERPIETWFGAADADHDGALTYDEFRADFARAFTSFDRDGDGEIEPEEVAHYETMILPEMASRGGGGPGRGPGMRGRGGGEGGRGGGPGGGMGRPGGGPGGGMGRPGRGERGAMARPGGGAMAAGAARFGLLPISHPLWDADADFNRGVSRAEYERAAGQRFAALDTARTGRLTLPDLTARRRPPRGNGAGVRPDEPGAD